MTDARHPQHGRAVLMLLLANFLWGISFPTIKALGLLQEALVPGASHWFVTCMTVAPRFLFATLVLLVLQARRLGDTTRSELRQGLLLGFFASGGMFLQNDGLQFTAASTSAFLTQLYAILIPVWLALRRRRDPGLKVWLCSLLVLVGVAVLGRFNWTSLSFGRGEFETLLCSLFFMGQILTLDRAEFSGNRPERITLIMMAAQMCIFWSAAWFTAPQAAALLQPFASWPWLGLTLILTLFCTLAAFMLMNMWQPRMSPTEAGLIYCVEPIFSSLLALFLPGLFSLWAGISYLNETATRELLLGGGLITLANVLLQLPWGNRRSEARL